VVPVDVVPVTEYYSVAGRVNDQLRPFPLPTVTTRPVQHGMIPPHYMDGQIGSQVDLLVLDKSDTANTHGDPPNWRSIDDVELIRRSRHDVFHSDSRISPRDSEVSPSPLLH
jgi:hypothetical protein